MKKVRDYDVYAEENSELRNLIFAMDVTDGCVKHILQELEE